MPLAKLFKVVTHFKFEVGDALTSTVKLESKLHRLSEEAQKVNEQFKAMAGAATLSLVGGHGGIVGTIQKAVNQTDAFYQSQLKLSTLMMGNKKMMAEPFKNFNEAMIYSKHLLTDMIKEANKFAIPVDDYIHTFNDINALLLPKGAAGKNQKNSRDLSRMLLMGSDVFGMSPGAASGALMSFVEGFAHPQHKLFRRLQRESTSMKGMSASRFNAMPVGKRVETLSKAFSQYLAITGQLEARLGSLKSVLTVLNNHFNSMGSVLTILGKSISGPLIKAIAQFNGWVDTKLKKTIVIVTDAIKPLVSNLEGLYFNILKITSLGRAFSLAKY